MTEREWFTTSEIGDMEDVLERTKRFSKRKMRLVSVGACRRVVHLIPPPISHELTLEWVESYVDGLRTPDGWARTSEPIVQASSDVPPTFYALAAMLALGPDRAPDAATLQVVDAVGFEAMVRHSPRLVELSRAQVEQLLEDNYGAPIHDAFMKACDAEELAIADLVRDIFGNPFHPVTFSPSWRTDTAISLARTMYESRDFGAMPILADALQDAGCDNDDVLKHCRSAKQVHVRGCWVVDLVLGKEW
jgi:hypothetical protein